MTIHSALVSSFTFPTLKNRVIMMNMPHSSSGQLACYFVAGPLVLAVALGISGARAQSGGPGGPVAATQARTAYVETAATVAPATHHLPNGVKTYLAKTYPGSTIVGCFVADHAADKAPLIQYYASIATRDGQRPATSKNASFSSMGKKNR